MKKIESTGEISLFDLIRLVFKNIFSIIYFTVVGLILGLIYVNTMMTPEYTATGTVAMKVSTNTTVLNTITEIAKSTNVAELALLALEEENVVLDSGEDITVEYIRSGITASYLATSLNVTINFVSEEQESSISILNAVLDATVSYANANYTVINNNLILGDYASTVTYSGQSKTLIFFVAILLGGILGVGIGLITDLAGGKLLFTSTINRLGLPLNRFLLSRDTNNNTEKEQIVNLQNTIESRFIDKPLKIIGFVNIDSKLDINETIKSVAFQYANSNLKTIVIDLDLQVPSIQKTFGIADDINICSVIENKFYQKPTFKKIAENLYVIPAKEHVYPSRVIKNPNFEKLIESLKNDFDVILVKLSAFDANDSSLVSSTFVDCLIVNVQINQTKTSRIIEYVNEHYGYGFNNIFINVFENKKSIPLFLKKISFHKKL